MYLLDGEAVQTGVTRDNLNSNNKTPKSAAAITTTKTAATTTITTTITVSLPKRKSGEGGASSCTQRRFTGQPGRLVGSIGADEHQDMEDRNTYCTCVLSECVQARSAGKRELLEP